MGLAVTMPLGGRRFPDRRFAVLTDPLSPVWKPATPFAGKLDRLNFPFDWIDPVKERISGLDGAPCRGL